MVLGAVAEQFSIAFERRSKFPDLLFGQGMIAGERITLAKPQAYMNRSGPPLRNFTEYYRIVSREILVVHDDIDLAFGRLKIKEKGGHGGHKGVESLIETFKRDDFVRLRIGVGRSAERGVTDHVLGLFNTEEKKRLAQIVDRARDAVISVLCKGVTEGMNRYNQKADDQYE